MWTTPNLNDILIFNKVINNCNLIDLGYNSLKFTWTNRRNHNQLIFERLDRFLANPARLNFFYKALVHHLPKTFSDHCPLVLDTNPSQLNCKKSLQIEPMWLSHPRFAGVIHNSWPPTSLNFIQSITTLEDTIQD